MSKSIILSSDSYKYSHYLQYPENTKKVYSYIESRRGMYPFCKFFGLQAYIKKYLLTPFTAEDIDKAEKKVERHIANLPFDRAGWEYILQEYGGYMPVKIRAVPEGYDIPTGNILVTVESLDDRVPWVVGHLETTLLRAIWYPTTVATRSAFIKNILQHYLDETTSEEKSNAVLPFILHDFGMRGATSQESAGISGGAHLINFMGTDNLDALDWVEEYYGEPMAGFSIPASEHTTMTIWGRDNEEKAFENMLNRFGKPNTVYANVVDSYDPFNVCTTIFPQLKKQLEASGTTMVVRPDSGEPVQVISQIIEALENIFGTTKNEKGFKVLNTVRIIQGDGVNETSIKNILDMVKAKGFSAENIFFGCGGYLLQDITRDTQSFVMKASAALIGDTWVDIQKDPITDPKKRSKRGKVTLYHDESKGYYSGVLSHDCKDVLTTVYTPGKLVKEYTYEDIRKNTCKK